MRLFLSRFPARPLPGRLLLFALLCASSPPISVFGNPSDVRGRRSAASLPEGNAPVGVPTAATPTATATATATATPCRLNEEFGDITTLPGAGWVQTNHSAVVGTTSWFQGNSTVFPAQSGAAASYIGANFNNTTGTNTISNWLLTPPVTLQNGQTMTFWTRTVDAPAFPDRLQVRMSTNGASSNVGMTATDVGDFTRLLLDLNPTYTTTGYPNVWVQFTVTVTGVPSATLGRLAFRYFVENGGPTGANSDYIGIDTVIYDLCGDPAPTATATATPTSTATPTATATGTGTPCPDTGFCESPTPTPGPTATVTTAPPTATPMPTPCGLTFSENFDDVTAPALPSGWTTVATTNVTPWATSTTFPTSGANDAFAFPASQGNNELITPVIVVPSAGAILSFQNLFNLMVSDAMVLEISINGGVYEDIIVAGGFLTGGYTGVVSACCGSPIAGRMAWLGLSAGSDFAPDYITTTLTLPAAANGQNIRLKWRLATDTFLPIFSAEGVRIDSIIFTPATCPTPTPTPTPSSTPARSLNLSTRMRVETGEQVGIGGFIITPSTGSGPGGGKQVLLRGIGPSLGQFGVPDPLADPIIELHGPAGFTTITNDNWKDTQQVAITATGLAPTDDLESAILATLDPGNYTAVIRGTNETSGVGLVEVYDLGPATSQLGNISTRAFVGSGGNVMIGGFILGDGDETDIYIRGLGPSLEPFGIHNFLADPTLELRDSNGALLESNDNCGEGPLQVPPEACIVISLPAGVYTAILAGKDGGTGVGLLEIYNLN